MHKPISRIIIAVLFVSFIAGCATYYQKNIAFQEQFQKGDIENANSLLDKNKKAAEKKDKLLYFLQKGVVLQMLGEYQQSNQFFEQAYFFTEDYQKNYTKEAASFLTNPSIKPYVGEDHEVVLLHYYKAINYLEMNMLDEALVECRRLNDKTNLLNDKYEYKKNRYKKDAFALTLMGLIYETDGDINNAFIAYRNAYEVYKEEYSVYFKTNIPEQLKKDLLKTAYLNGFYDEVRQYEKEFGVKYEPKEKPDAELVFFWHNGMGPVKGEWSINFTIIKGSGGMVTFANEEYGLNFPFPMAASGEGEGGFGDLKLVRVAFPKYVERKPIFIKGELSANGTDYPLEVAENINEIAFKTLEDRMLRELGQSLIRLAVKQFAEEQIRKESEGLGAVMSIVNAATEKADTRNWQTLPYSISYARIPLKTGENKVTLEAIPFDNGPVEKYTFDIDAPEGQILFKTFHSLESLPLESTY